MRTIQQQLKEKGLSESRIQEIGNPNTHTSFKSNEHLTRKEWEELMNANLPTYKRGKGGAMRRSR